MSRVAAAAETGFALLLFAWTTVLFRVRGQRAVAQATRRAMAVPPLDADEAAALQSELWRWARAVWRAKAIWPLESKCLQTALVTHRLLQSKGVLAPIRVGVKQAGGQTQGHAWVEVGPYAIDDSQLSPGFIPFDATPRTGALGDLP